MTAEKAREIKENFKPGVSSRVLWNQARGYLVALEGPEVKALVETLELCRRHFFAQTHRNIEKKKEWVGMSVVQILAAFRKAVKP